MESPHHLTFGPFRLDVTHGRLWRGEQPIALRPRSVAVLQYLAEYPGRLLTKAELRRQVWAGTHVTDVVLRVSIREIRAALGDSAATPQYVETVGQEGYRFLGGEPAMPPPLRTGPLAGRQGEVVILEQWFRRAASGHLQLGFVSGEVGIGKTAVVDLFLDRLAAMGGVRIARGRCAEHYGAGEPYLPLLGALGRFCRGPDGALMIALELLPANDVAAYVAGRCDGPVAPVLAAFVHQRTDGNALFMVNVVEHLVQRGLIVQREGQWTLREGAAAEVARVPEGVRQLLVRRIEELAPEAREVLEVASVVGEAFAVAAVRPGVQDTINDVQTVCDTLAAQHHFIEDRGVTAWPDGTRGGSYRFRHALYQQVLYDELGNTRRGDLHRRIGARLQAGYGAQAGESTSQLAIHFERGGEIQAALHAWQQVADTAAKGMGAPEAGEAYTRAHMLCQQLGETPHRFAVLSGLTMFHATQGRLGLAQTFGQQLLDLALCQPDPVLVCEGHTAVGVVALYRGDLIAARTHFEQSLEPSAAQLPSPSMSAGGLYPEMASLVWLTRTLWVLGYADQARQRSQETMAMARHFEHAPTMAYAEYMLAMLSQCLRETTATHARADSLMAFAAAQGLMHRVGQGRILLGRAVAMEGDAATGVQDIQQGMEAHQDMGIKMGQPYYLSLLAEAFGQAAQPEAGLQILAEALTLVATTEERWWEAELSRLMGALQLQLPIPDVPQAEASFHQALHVARGQQARAVELRAAMSLGRLWQPQGKGKEARQVLAPIYSWFTEGFDTADQQEAKALLDELS